MVESKITKRDIGERTLKFGIQVVAIVKLFPKTSAGFAIGGQVVRSGTSIGANIQEAQDGLSRKDFIHSMNIALKETKETYYWLTIIRESGLVTSATLDSLMQENLELIK